MVLCLSTTEGKPLLARLLLRLLPALHGPEISSRSIGLSPAFAGQRGRLLLVWFHRHGPSGPLKRTKHPLSLSTMLKPGGHWEAKTALGPRA
jgi:hypothetical protein